MFPNLPCPLCVLTNFGLSTSSLVPFVAPQQNLCTLTSALYPQVVGGVSPLKSEAEHALNSLHSVSGMNWQRSSGGRSSRKGS